MFIRLIIITTVICGVLQNAALAGLPIEWSGALGFDWVRINNARRTGGESLTYTPNSVIPDGASETAKYQSYVFRLEPKIIVNDSATVKGELSIGNNRGGQLGDSGTTNASFSQNGFFHYARPASSSGISANQIYIELFSESALYKIGRFSRGWGLGALYDDGTDMWDRFITTQDGIEVNYRFGNLSLSPLFTKISSEKYNSQAEVREIGVSLAYDNDNSGFSTGIYYGSRNAGAGNTYYTALDPTTVTATNYTYNPVGSVKLSVLDIYMEKKWEKFRLGFEAPILSGDIDNPYGAATNPATPVKYKASAYIFEADYQMSPSLKMGLNVGTVSGSDGSATEFGAMALNPNYQIAYLMFRYNMNAIDNTLGGLTATNGNTHSSDIFESSIKNTNFAKIYMEYATEKWLWKSALIFAKANEVAKTGQAFYNHEKGHLSNGAAAAEQKDDLGYELDLGFDYKWNPNILLGGFMGYHFVGDYFQFDNTANPAEVKNSFIIGLNLGLQF